MVSEDEVESIAKLADITIEKEKLAGFTSRFNDILEYFDILDQVAQDETTKDDLSLCGRFGLAGLLQRSQPRPGAK